MENSYLISGGRLLDPGQGVDLIGDLFIENGRINSIGQVGTIQNQSKQCPIVDATGLVVTPGFIDLHTHLRDPGFEDKETVLTGSIAAAKGGFTTICAMPNTNPSIDTVAVVRDILAKAELAGRARLLPIGCVTKGREGQELTDMGELADAGVIAFSDDGDPVFDPYLMRMALTYSAPLGLPIINHCQDMDLSRSGVLHEGWVASRLGLKAIPSQSEEIMVARDIELAALTGGRLHLAHLSTSGSLDLVRAAKQRGLPVTAEVTPHHLVLTQEWALGIDKSKFIDGAVVDQFSALSDASYDTQAKVNPPLRSFTDITDMVSGLRDGVIQAIATDHAPHSSQDKQCTFQEAAFGISGLETAFALSMVLVHRGEIDLPTLIERLTVGPSKILPKAYEGLGTFMPGTMGDVTMFDPKADWVVDTSEFASKGHNTPLEGVSLRGRIVATLLEGKFTFGEDALEIKPSR